MAERTNDQKAGNPPSGRGLSSPDDGDPSKAKTTKPPDASMKTALDVSFRSQDISMSSNPSPTPSMRGCDGKDDSLRTDKPGHHPAVRLVKAPPEVIGPCDVPPSTDAGQPTQHQPQLGVTLTPAIRRSIIERRPSRIDPTTGQLRQPPKPSPFITNRVFVSSICILLLLAVCVTCLRHLADRWSSLAVLLAFPLAVFMFEWEQRARYTLGRVLQRAWFDPHNLLTLPVVFVMPGQDLDAPTPYAPAVDLRPSDPASVAKRVQALVDRGESPDDPGGTPMGQALMKLLTEAVEAKTLRDAKVDNSVSA